MEDRKTVALIVPSEIVARGLSDILDMSGEFRIEEVFHDFSKSAETRLRSMDPDVVVIDPVVLDFKSRKEGRSIFSDICDSVVIALDGPAVTEDMLKPYDGSISLYDRHDDLLRKLRSALDSRQQDPATEGSELSAREKEILVCVAKGMLNKEIADKLNLSIYTVITHRKNITRKTGIKTVAGLTVYALLNNLLDVRN
ncbi:MAG: response regulator transcription factor [Bacteroidales bacterium]|nr:response regulator transcription factor [Bacteroidales bacterium]